MPKSPWVPTGSTKRTRDSRCPLMIGDKRCLLIKGHKVRCDNPLDFGDGSEIVFPKMSWMELKLIDMKTPQKMIDILKDALFLVRKKIEMS